VPRWSWALGLLLVAVAAAAWWLNGWHGPSVPLLGFFAVGVAAATGLRREDLRPKPLGLTGADAALLVVVVGLGLAWMASWRVVEGLSSDEALLVQTSGRPWLDAWTADKGLPSYVHGLLIAPTLWVGGIGAILALHAALYVLIAVVVLAALRRATGPGPARLAAVLLLLDPALLHQQQELRAYASYLALIALASLALVPRSDDDRPRWVPAVLGLALAALDAPMAAVLLAAVALAAFLDGGPRGLPGPRALLTSDDPAVRAIRAAVIAALGLSATVHTALSVRAEPRPLVTWWLMGVPGIRVALVTGTVATALGLLWWRTRPGALPVLAGLAAIGRIWAKGTLIIKEKYVLFLLPLGVPTALAALGRPLRRIEPLGSWLAVAVLVAATVAGRHGGPVLDPIDKVTVGPIDELLPRLALAGAVVGVLLLGRGGWLHALRGAVAGAVVVVGLADLGRTLWLERQWLRMDAGMREVADLVTARLEADPAAVACAPEPKVRLRLHAFALLDERAGWLAPLRRPRARGVHDRIVETCPATPHLWLKDVPTEPFEPPTGCTELARIELSPADQVFVGACGG
jgi:hypothetical protein